MIKTDWRNDAKNNKWYFRKWQNDADLAVFISMEKSKADKIDFYTDWSTNINFKWEN